MADKNNPTVGKPSTAAEGTVTQEEFEGALERGLIQVTVERPDPSEAFTKENLEKFIFGEITWAQLMGMTMEEAYNVAEIGYGMYEEGRFHDARTIFEALVLSNPYDAYFHNILGAIYQQLDMKEEALEQYSIAIDLDPEAMHAFVNRGEMLLQDGQFDAAIADFKLAVSLDKSGSDPALVRARALVTAATTVIEGVQKLFGKQLGVAARPKK